MGTLLLWGFERRLRSGALAVAVVFGALASPPAAADTGTFAEWLADFEQREIAKGLSADAIEAVLDGLVPDERMLQLDAKQTTTDVPVQDYAGSRLTRDRIQACRIFRESNVALLDAVEREFGVHAPYIIAVWSMETNLGAFPLNYDAARSVATLAYQGRRRAYFEEQLDALIRIVAAGRIARANLKSSWDGALGQAQLMPTTFLDKAVDWDRDGLTDLSFNLGDNAASIANFLVHAGWRRDEPVMVEVKAPAALLASDLRDSGQTVDELRQLGIVRTDGRAWTADELSLAARVYRPAGEAGPAFLLFHNFYALKSYNGSFKYGVTAALLAQTFQQAESAPAPLGRPKQRLDQPGVMEMQGKLAALGLAPGEIDGLFGEATNAALRAFQRQRHLPISDAPTQDLLEALRSEAGGTSIASLRVGAGN